MQAQQGQYAQVNGLKLYYETYGDGYPLVLVHGGGSTIGTSFGHIIPELARQYKVIALEMQAHGHTADIDRPLSFEQDADDVAALLQQLHISKANFLGFSNGGTTCLQVGIRHPQLVNKLVIASANYRRDGMPPGFFDGMVHATLDMMPKPLQDAFLAINPDKKALQTMFERDKARMIGFKDIPDEAIKGIAAPTLVMTGDQDVVSPEHAVRMFRTLPKAQMAILPAGHGDYLGEIMAERKDSPVPSLVAALIKDFLQ